MNIIEAIDVLSLELANSNSADIAAMLEKVAFEGGAEAHAAIKLVAVLSQA